MYKGLTGLMALGLTTGMAVANIVNSNFAPEQTYEGTSTEFAGPKGWVLRDMEGRRAVVSTVDFAKVGERVFWFETLSGGFGDNKLEQCVSLTDPTNFSFTVNAWTATPDSDLRVRLNVTYYADEDDCLVREDIDETEEDFRLEGTAETWTPLTLMGSVPAGATFARLRLSARDRTGSGNNPSDQPKFIYFDGLEVTGGSISNGDFEDTTFTEASFGEGQGPFGWTLRSVSDLGLVVPEPTAQLGSVFYFTELGDGFGDNTLEQCVDISGLGPFVFDASVRPNVTDDDLSVRLAVDLHANESDCVSRKNRIGRIDKDFITSDMTESAWNSLRSELIEPPATAEWARIALRARNQSDENDPIILFDQTALTNQFFVGGTLTGLPDGSEIILKDGTGQTLVRDASGAFAFPPALSSGSTFEISIQQQPIGAECTVTNGTGVVAGDDVRDVVVACQADAQALGSAAGGTGAGAPIVRSAPIINPNFALERAFAAEDPSMEEFAGPSGWVMRDLEDRRGLISTADFARSGDRVFRFESPQSGFGDNKLDQCLELNDPAADFGFLLHAWSSLSDPAVQVRVNVESYPNLADCEVRNNREDNVDFDFPLVGAAGTWQPLALSLPLNAAMTYARVSVRVRDRSNAGDPAEPPVTVLLDNMSAVNAQLTNGDFESDSLEGALFGKDQGPLGWTLRDVTEFGMIVPEPSAVGGSAFKFTALDEGFGDNTLEQCVPLDMPFFVFSAAVWPDRASPDLRVRLAVDQHATLEDCLNRDNRLDRRDADFRTSDLTVGSWNTIETPTLSRASGARFARLALRARDRSNPSAEPPVILFDQVRVDRAALAVPVNQPLFLMALLMLTLALGLRAARRRSVSQH